MVKKTAVAIIINSKNEFLLQKKTMDYIYFPGKWGFFGGGVEKGEFPEEAIKREVLEESGIEFNDIQFFRKEKYIINGINIEESIFVIKFNKNINEIKLGEGSGFAFFNKTELDSISLFSMARKILKEYISENN